MVKKDIKMRKFKKAFTMAEMLIVLVILAILAVFILSAITGASPDRIKTMFKKSYSVAERTIGELVNDESLYPYVDMETIGFLNTAKVDLPGGGSAGGASGSPEAKRKFCDLFAGKLNIVGEVEYGKTRDDFGKFVEGIPTYSGNSCYFETSDGVAWLLPIGATAETANYPLPIFVDVNGHEKGVNSTADSQERDIFTILFYADGRVSVPKDGKEVEYLRSHSVNQDKH